MQEKSIALKREGAFFAPKIDSILNFNVDRTPKVFFARESFDPS